MATEKQISANRRNARRSTGPKSIDGKRRSRRNAFRHGLAAETIIDLVEDRASYEAFEAMTKADYRPRGALENELVVRLASLIWRLRRATTVERGLFAIQVGMLQERSCKPNTSGEQEKPGVFYSFAPPLAPLQQFSCQACQEGDAERQRSDALPERQTPRMEAARSNITLSFLRLTNLESGVFERLGRYETRLWRQITQTIFLIEAIKRRERNGPQANRKNRFPGPMQEHLLQTTDADCLRFIDRFKA